MQKKEIGLQIGNHNTLMKNMTQMKLDGSYFYIFVGTNTINNVSQLSHLIQSMDRRFLKYFAHPSITKYARTHKNTFPPYNHPRH